MKTVENKRRFCVQCKHENLGSFQYCIRCGGAMEEKEIAPETQPLTATDYPERETEPSPDAVTIPSRKVLLLQFEGQFQSRLVDLPLGKTILLGRSASRDFTFLYDELIDLTEYGGLVGGVSRQHALIARLLEGLFIVDLDSKNGTFVDGGKLKRFESYELHGNEAIHLGYLKITLSLENRFPTS